MPTARLVLTGTTDKINGRTWQAHGPVRVGRLPDLELALDHTSVSRVHAEMTCDDRGWVVVDQGSTNGTFLNGMRVTRSAQVVREGDVLQFGHLILKVTEAQLGVRESQLLFIDRLQLVTSVTRSWEEVVQTNAPRDPQTAAPDRRLVVRHIGRDFYDLRSLDAYLEAALWQAADAIGAQYGAVLTWGPSAQRPDLRAELACGRELTRDVWVKSQAVHSAMIQGQSQLYVDLRAGSADGRTVSRDGNPGSLICALLRSPRRPLGLLCLARTLDRKPFDQDDLFLADDIALAIAPTVESLDRMLAEKRTILLKTLTALAQTVELRDASLSNHCQRVTDYALLIADQLRVSPTDRHLLQVGTPLYALGKIGVSDAVLQKPSSLTDDELDMLRSYPLRGAALVEAIPGLEDFLPIARNHGERWDGAGYPDGLAGEQIPLVARIVGLTVAFDAMTTDRPFTPALSVAEAFAEVERNSGTQFDPACVTALVSSRPEVEDMVRQRENGLATMDAAQMRKTRQSIVLGV